MSCPFRCGKGRIEYSPSLISQLSRHQLELFLKAEGICILLRHPYERQPSDCKRSSMSLASNLVLADNYDFSGIGYQKPSSYRLPEHQSYEWYATHLDKMNVTGQEIVVLPSSKEANEVDDRRKVSDMVSEPQEAYHSSQQASSKVQPSQKEYNKDDYIELKLPDGTSLLVHKRKPNVSQTNEAQGQDGEKETSSEKQTNDAKANEGTPRASKGLKLPAASDDHSQLWEEDVLMQCSLDVLVEDMKSWGTLPGNIVKQIVANTKAKIDYRKVLSGFRASILSSKRHLTRMRPNRRSGFDNMGSIRRFDTNLLIAVDVSASISDQTLCHFYSVINRMFKYGVEHVDVVQFDVRLGDVEGLEKRFKRIDVAGRGGTSFQPVFDYIEKHPVYDGMIIFTDGYAPKPHLSRRIRTKIVWVCDNMKNYEEHRSWMRTYGRCCPIEL